MPTKHLNILATFFIVGSALFVYWYSLAMKFSGMKMQCNVMYIWFPTNLNLESEKLQQDLINDKLIESTSLDGFIQQNVGHIILQFLRRSGGLSSLLTDMF